MIRRHTYFVDSQVVTHLLNHVPTKSLILVRHQLPREAKDGKIFVLQNVSYGMCCLILSNKCLNMSCEMILNYKHIIHLGFPSQVAGYFHFKEIYMEQVNRFHRNDQHHFSICILASNRMHCPQFLSLMVASLAMPGLQNISFRKAIVQAHPWCPMN